MGRPLAAALASDGWTVRGSTTSPEKVDTLRSDGVEPYVLRLNPNVDVDVGASAGDATRFFDSDVLFLNVPPPRGVDDRRAYHLRQIDAVCDAAAGRVGWIVFASSTGVYPDVDRVVTEDDLPPGRPDAMEGDRRRATGAILVEAEARLMDAAAFDATVVRFGGLYGGDRHPGRYLAGRTGVSRPEAPVNLVHRDDCVGLVRSILAHDARNAVFNAVSDGHPTRRDLYTHAAAALGLEPPTFDADDGQGGKEVSNRRLTERLGYTFMHPDPMRVEAVS